MRKLIFKRPWSMNRYQKIAIAMKEYGVGTEIVYPALKLNGEAGEVAEKVGKVLRDNQGIFTDEIKLAIAHELGDVLWYIAALSQDIGFTLDEVANLNVKKIKSRRKRSKVHGEGDNR